MSHRDCFKNERGNTIVIVLMVLVLITVIGITSMNDSLVEVKVATNDLLYKQSFFLTDGAFDLVAELLEQNIEASVGFPKADSGDIGVVRGGTNPYAVMVLDPAVGRPCAGVSKNLIDFWQNDLDDDLCPYTQQCLIDSHEFAPGRPSSNNLDMYFPAHLDIDDVRDASEPHTRIRLAGQTFFTEGAAIEMAAGYSGGGGKSGAGGGANRLYTIFAQTFGARSNDSLMMAQYRHVIGRE